MREHNIKWWENIKMITNSLHIDRIWFEKIHIKIAPRRKISLFAEDISTCKGIMYIAIYFLLKSSNNNILAVGPIEFLGHSIKCRTFLGA